MDSQILMYQSMDGFTKIETIFNEETVWLSIEQRAELFQSDTTTILRLIKNIFSEEELIQAAVTADFASTTKDNKTYQVKHYNLDVIISVGYRVKSLRGIQFRLWASGILKEYLKKGFAFNDEIIENNGKVTYFDKLIERIHDIRLTENVFWSKVLDIYSTSIDYDPKAEYSILLFQIV